MSISGLKKQVNKANQFVSEKISGVKGTDLDNVFIEKEKKTECLEKLVHEMSSRVHEILQPNPASRAKMAASKGLLKLKGNSNYPQPERALAETFLKFGPEFGSKSFYGKSLVLAGEAFQEIADAKYILEDEVNQNFLEPLSHLESKEIKEVNFHKKKMEGRRLDFDCKKRKKSKGGSITEEELGMARSKFEESKCLAEAAMTNLLNNDTEQVSQLLTLLGSLQRHHARCDSLFTALLLSVDEKKQMSITKDHRVNNLESSVVFTPHSKGSSSQTTRTSSSFNNTVHVSTSKRSQPLIALSPDPASEEEVKVQALYDFTAEDSNELDFSEGAIIRQVTRVDDNWLQGSFKSKVGFFPLSYVKIVSGSLL